ncbi:unnamed protein product [Cladocopium goreaui]|uniref:C3H1-type domain-containing protein n=1 Tax=Cladocopium goreaui TaxID=2562237 RepID=A0A9P1D9T1_9DINO|nr:unnamed protein product [Cladocopium goreaui]
MMEQVILHFSVKNTFLDVRPLEDVPPIPRRKSWSSGDTGDPTEFILGLSKVANGQEVTQEVTQEAQNLPEIHEDQSPSQMLAKHRTGRCKPCVFFASVHGCPDAACSFCHLAHRPPPKQRPEKQLRNVFKAAVQTVFQMEDHQALRLALKNLAPQHPYLHWYIIGQMDMYSQRVVASRELH